MKQTAFETQPDTRGIEQPTMSDLLSRRDEAVQMRDQADDELRTIEATLHPHDINESKRIVAEYAATDDDPLQALIEHGHGVLPAAYYDAARHAAMMQALLDDITDVLDDAADESLGEYVQDEAMTLFNQIKRGDLNRMRYTDDEQNVIDHTVATLEELCDRQNDTYELDEQAFDKLERCRSILDDLNMLVDGEVASDIEPTYDVQSLKRAQQLNNRYRTYNDDPLPDAAQFYPMLPLHNSQTELDSSQRELLMHHLQSIDAKQEVNRITITGVGKLPFDYRESSLRQLLYEVPAIALEGVESITFKDGDDEGTLADSPYEPWEAFAYHEHDAAKNSADIVVRVDQVGKLHDETRGFGLLFDDGSALTGHDDSDDVSIQTMEQVILHEFGHAFHQQLPVSLLNDWDIVARAGDNDQPVTDYVAEVRNAGHVNYGMEDFADNFMLALVNPDELQRIAPDRYTAMTELIRTCRPVEQ